MKKIWIPLLMIFVAFTAHSAVEVHTATDFPETIQKIAVAPIPCHEEVNCQKVEKALGKSVKKYFPNATVITTEDINQAFFDRSIVEVTKEAVIEVAKELGCDAILLPSVVGSEAKDHWNAWTDYETGQSYSSNVHSVASTVEVIIVAPDGKLLMKGQASGDSYLQTDPTYFAESQFDKILRKATK
jgi:hypothetical protein